MKRIFEVGPETLGFPQSIEQVNCNAGDAAGPLHVKDVGSRHRSGEKRGKRSLYIADRPVSGQEVNNTSKAIWGRHHTTEPV